MVGPSSTRTVLAGVIQSIAEMSVQRLKNVGTPMAANTIRAYRQSNPE